MAPTKENELLQQLQKVQEPPQSLHSQHPEEPEESQQLQQSQPLELFGTSSRFVELQKLFLHPLTNYKPQNLTSQTHGIFKKWQSIHPSLKEYFLMELWVYSSATMITPHLARRIIERNLMTLLIRFFNENTKNQFDLEKIYMQLRVILFGWKKALNVRDHPVGVTPGERGSLELYYPSPPKGRFQSWMANRNTLCCRDICVSKDGEVRLIWDETNFPAGGDSAVKESIKELREWYESHRRPLGLTTPILARLCYDYHLQNSDTVTITDEDMKQILASEVKMRRRFMKEYFKEEKVRSDPGNRTPNLTNAGRNGIRQSLSNLGSKGSAESIQASKKQKKSKELEEPRTTGQKRRASQRVASSPPTKRARRNTGIDDGNLRKLSSTEGSNAPADPSSSNFQSLVSSDSSPPVSDDLSKKPSRTGNSHPAQITSDKMYPYPNRIDVPPTLGERAPHISPKLVDFAVAAIKKANGGRLRIDQIRERIPKGANVADRTHYGSIRSALTRNRKPTIHLSRRVESIEPTAADRTEGKGGWWVMASNCTYLEKEDRTWCTHTVDGITTEGFITAGHGGRTTGDGGCSKRGAAKRRGGAKNPDDEEDDVEEE